MIALSYDTLMYTQINLQPLQMLGSRKTHVVNFMLSVFVHVPGLLVLVAVPPTSSSSKSSSSASKNV